jgi:hypothetical protein
MNVFISYAHESTEHKLRVRQLADSLRAHGLVATIDQYVQGTPEGGWPRWMDQMLESSDRVLLVCSAAYYRRWIGKEETGKGRGVTWEATLTLNDLYDAQGKNSKFIPVIFSEADRDYIPRPLRGSSIYLIETAEQFGELYRDLTRQAWVKVMEVGDLVHLPEEKGLKIFTLNEEASLSGPAGRRETLREDRGKPQIAQQQQAVGDLGAAAPLPRRRREDRQIVEESRTPARKAKVWDPAVLERASKDLAVYIGPMAKVIVSRAAERTLSMKELYEALAAEIVSPSDRQKFLASQPL